jgi:hypothetical protein
MIQSTPSPDRSHRPDPGTPPPVRPSPRCTATDHFSADGAAALRASLRSLPEVRPEVVARGRELASDPAYPSREILGRIGRAILNAPDLSEDLP